ncbi:MAG: acetyl-CoA hydrolase/transferase [Frankiales bacterium]|nr:acetyl-CoA hydrolase/transferase [Frankiales bacterium]
MSAAEAVQLVQPGDRVWVGSACGTPRALLAALNQARLPGVKLVHFLADGVTVDGEVRYPQEVFFVGSELRGIAGPVDYLPVSLPELPALIARGQHRIDVALIQVSPPDENGLCSLGVSVDVTHAAALAARTVLAEINPAMPRTGPTTVLPVSRIAAFVEVDPVVREYVHEPAGETAERIAPYVARLVPDGATLQLGLGRIPDDMQRHLSGRRGLRVHSDVITDGVVDLLDSGAVRPGPGAVVASMAVGTARLFDRLDASRVVLEPLEDVCRLGRLAAIERLVSVTQAFAVDLTGQVCTDTDDGQRYGGVASQSLMHWMAAHSRGGRAVVCLASTFPDGSSRIRPALLADEAATIGRADVHYVVTEYGTAYLFGRSLRERAVALIELAHPSVRAALLNAAAEAGLVPEGQSLRSRGAYPGDEERTVTLTDGATVLVRPARTGDAPALQDLFYRMPPADVFTRFFRHLTTLPLSTAEHLTSVSFEDEVTFLAVVGDWGSEQVVGTVSYYLDPTSGQADVAFMVDPDWKGRGLGSALRDVVVDAARRRGVVALTADVLVENRAMLAVFRASGLPLTARSSHGVTEVVLTL